MRRGGNRVLPISGFTYEIVRLTGKVNRSTGVRDTTMGNFTFLPTRIPGVTIIEPKVYGDARGYFMETYSEREFHAAGITCAFVQDNQSKSRRGVLRGLHFQVLHPQAKLVRVIYGEVFDVAVDIRKGSPTFGQWAGVTLSAAAR